MASGKVPDLGRYRLEKRLGSGSMGDVWEAQDLALARRVAVKVLKPNAEDAEVSRTRFIREARVAAALRHPNIVVAHDVGEIDGICFFVMELVEGRPLRSLLGERVSLEEKVRWLREMADALAAMHEAGIIHRDVKPENVIIRTNGSACLVDLGIAKWTKQDGIPVTQRNTATEVIVGTPDYLPPETCYAGFFDELGDQYAWAVTAYELLLGAHPSEVLDRPLTDRRDIPPSLAVVVERARSRLPASRYPNMRALSAALGTPNARTSDQPIVVNVDTADDEVEKAPDTLSDRQLVVPPRQRSRSIRAPKLSVVVGAALGTLVMHGLILAITHHRASTPTPRTDSTATSLRVGRIWVDGRYSEAQKKEFVATHHAAFTACASRAEPICHVYRYIVECGAHPDGHVDQCHGSVGGPRARGALECEKLADCFASAVATRVDPYSVENGSSNVSYEIRVEP